jgi:hypothetical protein
MVRPTVPLGIRRSVSISFEISMPCVRGRSWTNENRSTGTRWPDKASDRRSGTTRDANVAGGENWQQRIGVLEAHAAHDVRHRRWAAASAKRIASLVTPDMVDA